MSDWSEESTDDRETFAEFKKTLLDNQVGTKDRFLGDINHHLARFPRSVQKNSKHSLYNFLKTIYEDVSDTDLLDLACGSCTRSWERLVSGDLYNYIRKDFVEFLGGLAALDWDQARIAIAHIIELFDSRRVSHQFSKVHSALAGCSQLMNSYLKPPFRVDGEEEPYEGMALPEPSLTSQLAIANILIRSLKVQLDVVDKQFKVLSIQQQESATISSLPDVYFKP